MAILWDTFIKKKFLTTIKKFSRRYKKKFLAPKKKRSRIYFFLHFLLIQCETTELTRQEYNLIAERRGIKKPLNIPTKKLLNTLNRYDTRRKGEKLSKIRLGKVAKIPNCSQNEVNQAEKLQRRSIDELKEIARLRRIKNRDKLTK